MEKVKVGDDPPDFWVTVDGDRYAAEVTSIVTKEECHAEYRRFEQSLRDRAQEQGSLSGRYILGVRRYPRLPRIGSPEWKDLVERGACFIRESQGVESTDERRLVEESNGRLSIQKIFAEGMAIGTIGPTVAKREGEIQNELRQLMATSVAKKRKKLEKKGVPAQCPRIILLFYDAYGLGRVEDAQKALLDVPGYDWYHSVFWATSFTDRPNELSAADPGRVGVFLHTKNEKWRGVAG